MQEQYQTVPVQLPPEKEQLTQEVDSLRQIVRQLRLEKVKAKAEQQSRQGDVVGQPSRGPSRYSLSPESMDVPVPPEGTKGKIHFGRIRKNRGKSVGGVGNSNNLTHLINIDRLYINHTPQSSSQTPDFQQPLFQTMELKPVGSNAFSASKHDPFTTPVSGHSNMSEESNRITVRGEEICSKMMQKFHHDETRFRKFVKREASRSRVNSLATQPRPTDNSRVIPHQQRMQSQRTEDFEGSITRNNRGSHLKEFVDNLAYKADEIIDPSKLQLITQL